MKNKFRSVAIYCHHKPSKEKIERIFIRDLVRFLHLKGVKQIHGDLRTKTLLQNGINLMNNDSRYDLKIGIGGDGTLLKMVRDLQKKDGIFVGINFGTLGFLSELTPDNAFEGLRQIFNGNYEIDERQLIKSFVYRKNEQGQNKKIFASYSLNEVVFGHGGLARITNFSVKAARRSLSTYRGDGLIFATPTGSTAYSMSAGGPILHPSVPAIIVTPVAPHALTHRPIVLPNDEIIHLKFDSRADTISMTIDGQIHFTLKPDDEVSLQKATRTARFVRTKKNYYFKTLRNKLNWGS